MITVELDSHIVLFIAWEIDCRDSRAALKVICTYIETVILVFDITDKASFEAVKGYYDAKKT